MFSFFVIRKKGVAEYKLMMSSNEMVLKINDEIEALHKFLRDHYGKQFPELEQLVPNAVDYARTAERIGQQTDISNVDLTDVLPAASIMVVTVMSTTTEGNVISQEEMELVNAGCKELLFLDDAKGKLLKYVESRMDTFVPNLTALVGSSIASKLVGLAGGLRRLASLPGNTVQILGYKKHTYSGFGGVGNLHGGLITDAEIVARTPPSIRKKTIRVLGAKCVLAARMDAFHQQPDGNGGKALLAEIEKKLDKWQEPLPGRQEKALPLPIMTAGKRRGGRKARALKAKMGLTDIRQAQQKMLFGVPQLENEEGEGMGIVGLKNTGKLRMQVKSSNVGSLTARKKLAKMKKKDQEKSGTLTGLTSQLAFTPVQGFELVNPRAKSEEERKRSKYFSSMMGFRVPRDPKK